MPRLPSGAKAPRKITKATVKKRYVAPKAAKVPKKKPSTHSLPGYKVPSKLTKPTAANKKAGLPSLASVLKKSDDAAKKYNSTKRGATNYKPPVKKKKPAAKKSSSDYEKGLKIRDWARGQGLGKNVK